jgi:hypothetical protein
MVHGGCAAEVDQMVGRADGASVGADRVGEGGDPEDVDDVDDGDDIDDDDLAELFALSRAEMVLLGRYAAARSTLDSLQPLFRGKYGLLLIGVVVGAGVMSMGEGVTGFVAVFVAFLFLALLHHALEQVVRRAILRLGAHDRLAELDPIYEEMTDWQAQLRSGLRRAGSPWRMLRGAARSATGRDDDTAFIQNGELVFDWRTSLPLDRLRDARAILSRAAGPEG